MYKDSAINMYSTEKECSVRVEFKNGFAIERQKKKGKVRKSIWTFYYCLD